MAKKWSEVIQSPEYQALPDQEKEAARNQYFEQVVTPQLTDPNELTAARSQFDQMYGPKKSAAPAKTVQPAAPSGIDVASWFTGKKSTKGILDMIGDKVLPTAQQRADIRKVDPVMNTIMEAGDPLQHHLMNFPYGLSQSLVNAASYGADKLLGKDSGIATTMRNDANSFNRDLTQREKDYQARNPDTPVTYAGAAAGEIIPWTVGLPEKVVSTMVSKIAPKGSGIARRALAGGATGAVMSTAAPVTGPGNYGDQKATQAGFGALTGGSIPLVTSGLGGAYSGGKELFNMVFRPESVAAKNLARIYKATPETVDKLRSAPEYVPGETVTAAQALQTPEAVMAEKAMRNRPEFKAAFTEADNANNRARMGVVEKYAGTDAELNSAVNKRRSEANAFANDTLTAGPENQRYAKAAKILEDSKGPRMSSADFDQLNTARLIFNRVHRGTITEAEAAQQLKGIVFKSKFAQKSFDQAMTAVNKNMVSPKNIVKQLETLSKSGNPTVSAAASKNLEVIAKNADSTGKVPAFALDDIRQNLGKMLSDSAPNGVVGSVESAKYGPVSTKIISTLERQIPGYSDYLRAYRANSQPINTMEAGRSILGPISNRRLNSGGDQTLTLNDLAQGFKRDNKARYGMSTDAKQALTGVQDSLKRRSISDSISSPGSDTAYNLQADSWLARNILGQTHGGPSGTTRGIATLLGAYLGNKTGMAGAEAAGAFAGYHVDKAAALINARISNKVGEGAINSQKAADMIEKFLKENPQNRKQLLERYPQWVQLIGNKSTQAIEQQ